MNAAHLTSEGVLDGSGPGSCGSCGSCHAEGVRGTAVERTDRLYSTACPPHYPHIVPHPAVAPDVCFFITCCYSNSCNTSSSHHIVPHPALLLHPPAGLQNLWQSGLWRELAGSVPPSASASSASSPAPDSSATALATAGPLGCERLLTCPELPQPDGTPEYGLRRGLLSAMLQLTVPQEASRGGGLGWAAEQGEEARGAALRVARWRHSAVPPSPLGPHKKERPRPPDHQ